MTRPFEDEVPTHLKDLLVQINFIGSVPPNRKINIRTKTYIDPSLWLTAPYRYAIGEHAEKTCEYIDGIIKRLTEALVFYRKKGTSTTGDILVKRSKELRGGILNLINTYQDNPSALAKLRTSLELLDKEVPENKTDLSNLCMEGEVSPSPTVNGFPLGTPCPDDI